MGDGKWMQSVDGVTRDPHVAGTVRAEPGTTIGFASMGVTKGRTFYIEANINAPGATVLFNTTDALETSVFNSANTAGNHHTNNRRVDEVVPNRPIVVSGVITAETVKAQNGQLTLGQSLFVPNLDIAGIATVNLASGMRASISGALTGTGKWTGGDGVFIEAEATIDPGDGIGVINEGGGALSFEDGAIYKWQVGTSTGEPGLAWDLVKGSDISFLGGLVIDIDDSMLADSIDGTETFILMSASTSMGALPSYSFAGTWSGTLTVVGNDLVLSALSGSLAGDANGDGVADAADYIIWKQNFGNLTGNADVTMGDFNGDGNVTVADLVTLNTAMNGAAGQAVTPEPATLALLAFGGLAVIRRRRK